MTKSTCRSFVRSLLAFAVAIFAATSWAQTRPPILEKVAKAYGLHSWEQIEAIRYTGTKPSPAATSRTRGNGSPKPARSPTKERIRTASL
jgi:hypothetical protein